MIDFNQNAQLSRYSWDQLLLDFIRAFNIGFIKLELLMLFYRGPQDHLSLADVVKRTGYHPQEVSANLAKLVNHRFLLATLPDAEPPRYRRLTAEEYDGRDLAHAVIERMARDFNERVGRLRIIYAVVKVQAEIEDPSEAQAKL